MSTLLMVPAAIQAPAAQAPATTGPATQSDVAPAAPAAPIQADAAQATDIATLRAQIQDLRVQRSGLQAQWNRLYSQLDAMLKTNPARPGVQQAWADVGVQLARLDGEIAYREARIRVLQGTREGTTAPPPSPPSSRIDPDLAIISGTLLTLALGLPVSIAWARRILRGRPQAPVPPPAPDQSARLERLEHAIDAVAIEVERIAEGQRFVTKILAGRAPSEANAPSDALHRGAAATPKALGAGPMEPIVVPEHERVQQPIVTPH